MTNITEIQKLSTEAGDIIFPVNSKTGTLKHSEVRKLKKLIRKIIDLSGGEAAC